MGLTSHDVVARLRKTLGTRAVGHAGTLDPFATGLLVILVGRATRLARFVERHPKRYLAEAVLGVATATDDRDGAEIRRVEMAAGEWPDRETVAARLAGFLGRSLQRPPAFSARKVEGRRAYALARKGEPVELEARTIEVFTAELLDWTPPVLRFRVEVSAGTYVRALARDLGDRLGIGGHLRSLRREAVGPFRVEQAVALDAVEPGTALLSARELLAGFLEVPLAGDEAVAVGHGRRIEREGSEGEAVLLLEGRAVAVAEAVPGGWHPRVVLEPA